MTRSNPVETFLFWLMLLMGAAVLVPSLLLPPWIEHARLQAQHQQAQAQLAATRRHLAIVEKQIDCLKHDPAYVLRLVENGCAPRFRGPIGHADNVQERLPTTVTPRATVTSQLIERYPVLRGYVDGRTRPALLAMGGTLLLTAIVLLGRPSRSRVASRSADHSASKRARASLRSVRTAG